MSPSSITNSPRRRLRWIACAVLAVLAIAVLAVGSSRSADAAGDQRTLADRLEIAQWRARLHQTLLDEVNALVLGLVDQRDAAMVDQARAARIATHSDASAALTRIAESDSGAADEAMELCDLLTADGLEGTDQVEAVRLNETAWAVVRVGVPSSHQLSETERRFTDLVQLGTAGAVVLNDALDAAFVTLQPTPTRLVAEYVRRSERSIHEAAGFYGADDAHPLSASPLYRPTADEPLPLVGETDAMIAATDLWSYDAWNRSWHGRPRPPDPAPLPLADLVDLATTTDAAIRQQVDSALDTARADADAAADADHRRAVGEAIGAALLAAIVLATAAVAGTRVVRRFRATAALVATDRLTGVGNRHALHTETAALLNDPTAPHHLVAMVDLDRFKIVNDSWGHAVGDQVLCELADALTAVVDGHRRSGGGPGTVIRLGGDEFLLTLHSRRPIDQHGIAGLLDAIRHRWIEPTTGERLPLSFSLGIVALDGPSDVDDVVRTADLAAYEDKARRAAILADRRTPLAPPAGVPVVAPTNPQVADHTAR